MRHLVTAVILSASLTLAAPPKRADVVKRFPVVSLPFAGAAKQAAAVTLTAADVEALGFQKLTGAPKDLLTWTATPEEGETHTLAGIGQAKVGATTLLFVLHVVGLPMSSETNLHVLALSGDALTGAATVETSGSSEAGDTTSHGTVAADGTITRKERSVIPTQADGLPETMEVTSEATQKLRANGSWEPTVSRATTQNGKFVDAKSKEELWVFGQDVFYRGNESKPFQKLDFDGKAVRFKGSKTPYTLAWNEPKQAIACTDPKGKAQTFTREW